VCICGGDGDAEFYVVPPEEAGATADRVSARSPLGGALLGRHVGDVVRFRAPGAVLADRGRRQVMPRKDRPQCALVHFRGITYEMDILARERALLQRHVGRVRHPALEERLQIKRQARAGLWAREAPRCSSGDNITRATPEFVCWFERWQL
jgi:hypothetical protein